MFCFCTGPCKTNRCVCKKLDQGCTPGKCRCKSSKCCRKSQQWTYMFWATSIVVTVNLKILFCICRDNCSTTLCFCLAIKQVPCTTRCKCEESHCKNRTSTADVVVQPPSRTLPISEDVKQFCATKSKGELEELLVSMASKCPQLWNSLSKTDRPPVPSKPHLPPTWCKCVKCHPEPDPENQICCKNQLKP